MQSLRDFLPPGFCDQMEKELGREETLKLLWPAIVGSTVAASTKPLSLRGDTLIVAVPDRAWLNSLGSFEQQILNATARFWGKPVATRIDFVQPPLKSKDATSSSSADRREPV